MSSQGHAHGTALDSRDAAFFEVLEHSFASPPGGHIVVFGGGVGSGEGVGGRVSRAGVGTGGGSHSISKCARQIGRIVRGRASTKEEKGLASSSLS